MKTWRKIALNRYRYTLQQQYTEAGMLVLIPVSVMLRYCVSHYARILYVLHVYFR